MDALANAFIEGGGEIFVSNREFLNAIFGPAHHDAHVTAFQDDPSAIPQDRLPICWAGNKFAGYDYMLPAGANQYFCISIFGNVDGRAVRRKSEFLFCCVIVADDVKDKVPEYKARLLPPPSWRLETSPGNEQWGWILYFSVADRAKVDNLLDGLVEMGLAPDGVDPGMKGVTRYVRLPEGWNTKAKYGAPFKCRMLEWRPDRKVELGDLAAPFGVDLEKRRSDDKEYGRSDGGYPDHPVFEYVEILGDAPNGGYNIVCPWDEEHGDRANSGTWLTINADSTLGFFCHHGHCQGRGVQDFLDKTESRDRIDTWRVFREIKIDETQNGNSVGEWGLAGVSIATEAPERVVSMHDGTTGDGVAGTGVQGGAGTGEVAASSGVYKQPTRGIEDEQMAMEPQTGGVGAGQQRGGAAGQPQKVGMQGNGGEMRMQPGQGGTAPVDKGPHQAFAGAESYIRTNNVGSAQSGEFFGAEVGYPQVGGGTGGGGAVDGAGGPLEEGGEAEADEGVTGVARSEVRQSYQVAGGVPDEQGNQTPQPWHAIIATLPPDPSADLDALRRVIEVLVKLNAGLERESALKALKDAVRNHLRAGAIDIEVKKALKVAAKEKRKAKAKDCRSFNDVANGWVYVGEIHRFVNRKTSSMLTKDAFKCRFMYLEDELKDVADETGESVPSDILAAVLKDKGFQKVDTVDYHPGETPVYMDMLTGKIVFNMWTNIEYQVKQGDPSLWLNHFTVMRLNPADTNHLLDWMAYTLQHPEQKINHIIVIGGREGIGKDYILQPMMKALGLGTHSKVVDGSELNTEFNEHLYCTKHLHVNELEAGNKKDRTSMTQKLKHLATAPPDVFSLNRKGIPQIQVRKVVNVSATTNEQHSPIAISVGARRYFMVWSDVVMRDSEDNMLSGWDHYWKDAWKWMNEEENWKVCVNHLLNRDVSHFNPGKAPPMTDHQRRVVKSSQSPLDHYIDDLMESRSGVFAYDLLTANRVFDQLTLDLRALDQYGFYGKRVPGTKEIGRVLTNRFGAALRAQGEKNRTIRAYVIENHAKYLQMSSREIGREVQKYPFVTFGEFDN